MPTHQEAPTIRQIISETETALKETGIENPKGEAEILLEKVTALDKFNLYFQSNKKLSASQLKKITQMISMRKSNIPIQYIAGKAYFRNLVLDVAPEVLIPRPETEQLVELVIEKCKKSAKHNPVIVDAGTGCGAIAISLAKEFPLSKLIATDISKKALNIASKNAYLNGVSQRVRFLNTFLMDSISDKVDIIVANLPYIPSAQLDSLPEEVKKEPRIALDGGNNGYELIEKLILASAKKLKNQGSIFLEIGISQADAIANIIYSVGFKKVMILKDFSNADRYVIGEF